MRWAIVVIFNSRRTLFVVRASHPAQVKAELIQLARHEGKRLKFLGRCRRLM